jgi:hypothetical protein
MKRMHDPTAITDFFVKAGLIAALSAALLAPMTINTQGKDRPESTVLPMSDALDALPPPPIEPVPWLTRALKQKGFEIDTLLAPKFELMGPEVAEDLRPLLAGRAREGR